MSYEDLPIIHVFPNGTPSDAELEAQRDAKHVKDVAAYEALQAFNPHDQWYWPVTEVIG
jgi:hypothetical protein